MPYMMMMAKNWGCLMMVQMMFFRTARFDGAYNGINGIRSVCRAVTTSGNVGGQAPKQLKFDLESKPRKLESIY